jgi:hypothetical protein
MPVFWLMLAMVCGLRESLNARTTARPRASEVMKAGIGQGIDLLGDGRLAVVVRGLSGV